MAEASKLINDLFTPTVARECEVCGEAFEILWYENKWLCPECKVRLRNLLYEKSEGDN